MRIVGAACSVGAIVCGLFGILAPAAAWLALAFSFFSYGSDSDVAGDLALLGSQALTFLVVSSVPVGAVLGAVGLATSRAADRSVAPALIGLGFVVAAPITWIITWAGVIGGLMYLFQDFHF